MNARSNQQQSETHDADHRQTRRITLVWGPSPGNGTRARWLDPIQERQEASRGAIRGSFAI